MIKKVKHLFIMIGVSSVLAACLSCCSGHASGGDELKCRVVEVEGGYGYMVLCGSDTLIYQPYIPAVSGKRAFSTKKDAMKIGQLVCRKLVDGQSPTVSKEEIAGNLPANRALQEVH